MTKKPHQIQIWRFVHVKFVMGKYGSVESIFPIRTIFLIRNLGVSMM